MKTLEFDYVQFGAESQEIVREKNNVQFIFLHFWPIFKMALWGIAAPNLRLLALLLPGFASVCLYDLQQPNDSDRSFARRLYRDSILKSPTAC